jgi:hypothetical protein
LPAIQAQIGEVQAARYLRADHGNRPTRDSQVCCVEISERRSVEIQRVAARIAQSGAREGQIGFKPGTDKPQFPGRGEVFAPCPALDR